MTSLTLTKARDGGFYVLKVVPLAREPHIMFAGSLKECLEYMENEIHWVPVGVVRTERGGLGGVSDAVGGVPPGAGGGRYQAQGGVAYGWTGEPVELVRGYGVAPRTLDE